MDIYAWGDLSMNHFRRLYGEAFEFAERGVRAPEDPFGKRHILESRHDHVLKTLHARGKCLDGQIIAVAIDDQARELVRFAENPAVGAAVRVHLFAPIERLGKALFKKRSVNFLVFLIGQNAEGNQRMGMVKAATEKTLTGLK